jgi:hypothetical protein
MNTNAKPNKPTNSNRDTGDAARSRIPRLKVVALSATAGITLFSSVALAYRQDRTPVNPAVEDHRYESAIAEWARANDLSGLSPSSLSPARLPALDNATRIRAGEQAAIAAWAKENGFTGLSPASLHKIDD